jgi:hypothetical protein
MSFSFPIKRFIPGIVKRGIGNLLARHRERRLGRLPIQEAFDEVYRRGMWKHGRCYSGPGSEGPLADRYVGLVLDYAATHKLRTVVDGGCGDFSVGSRLAPSFDRYLALDVSPVILKINQQRYADLSRRHVSFEFADMTSTTFPRADLILIRQVLQHLTNRQVEQILTTLEASDWRRALITEDVCNPRYDPIPNLDLPSHTIRTRTSLNSGVFIDRAPFNRPAKRMAFIDGVAAGERSQSGLLVFELIRADSSSNRRQS